MRKRIALDFDSTLAFCDADHHSIDDQEIIPAMKRKVENWIAQGYDVYLHTAQAGTPEKIEKLRAWLDKEGLQKIEKITDKKLPKTLYYVEDCAVKVTPNTGDIPGIDPITKDVNSEIRAARMSGRY
jgi:5'(3')-deoxyribonucleotidase